MAIKDHKKGLYPQYILQEGGKPALDLLARIMREGIRKGKELQKIRSQERPTPKK